MPRLRRSDKRRHEMTLEVFCALANMCDGHTEEWARFWGGEAEARAAFEALRYEPGLEGAEGESYDEWLARPAAGWGGPPPPRQGRGGGGGPPPGARRGGRGGGPPTRGPEG